MQIYSKSINKEEGLMKLRQDLRRKKVVKLVYQDFVLPEPNFGDLADRETFYTIQENITNERIKKDPIQANITLLRYRRNPSGLITYRPQAHCCKR